MIAPNAPVRASQSEERPSVLLPAEAGREDAAPPGPARAQPDRSLRPSAVKADMTATKEIPLALLWRELTRGGSKIVDGFFYDERCYLLITKRATPGPALCGKRLEILEAVLSGHRQKNIAIDRGLAPSTVALNSRLALEALGVSHRPSRAHPLLMLAARSASLELPAYAKSATFVSDRNEELRVVSTLRPDTALSRLLPSAELSVIRKLVEGACYEDIARARGTSTRTIANQISMVFRRLRVSGRNELVQRLFGEGAPLPAQKPTPPLHPPSLALRKSA